MRKWVRRYRTALVVASAAVIVAAFAVLVWRGAPWLDASRLKGLTPVQRETAIDAIRGRTLTLGAGLLATGALVYTALNFRLSRESHVTDRYTKAIEQLGSEGLDVRLGAIYALERIMIDSPRDHPTIVEVLAAFVREHSRSKARDQPADVDADAYVPDRTETDVLAAATVIGRRPPKRDERGRLNLSEVHLMQWKLPGARLAGADLNGANLTRATLNGADLTGAWLRLADLTRAYFNGANLTSAFLMDANLTEAHLTRANLAHVVMGLTDLTRVNLNGANLLGAHMPHVNLTYANLAAANLAAANLTAANLTGATLTGANLNGANLTRATLTEADLTGATLTRATLTEADLTGATLTRAALTGTVLPASALDNPSLPDQYRPPAPDR